LNQRPRPNREISFLERRTNVPVAQSERAEENRAYVRRLLWEREPEFAAALAAVEHSFPCPACPGEWNQAPTPHSGPEMAAQAPTTRTTKSFATQ